MEVVRAVEEVQWHEWVAWWLLMTTHDCWWLLANGLTDDDWWHHGWWYVYLCTEMTVWLYDYTTGWMAGMYAGGKRQWQDLAEGVHRRLRPAGLGLGWGANRAAEPNLTQQPTQRCEVSLSLSCSALTDSSFIIHLSYQPITSTVIVSVSVLFSVLSLHRIREARLYNIICNIIHGTVILSSGSQYDIVRSQDDVQQWITQGKKLLYHYQQTSTRPRLCGHVYMCVYVVLDRTGRQQLANGIVSLMAVVLSLAITARTTPRPAARPRSVSQA